MNFRNKSDKGFTLVELLVGMAITGIMLAGLYSVYTGQQKAHLAQVQVIDMQQNLRAALLIMTREIRMAGYDPYVMYGAGMTAIGNGSSGNPMSFTLVADTDGVNNDLLAETAASEPLLTDETGELKTVAFELFDADGDGDTDLGRSQDGGGLQPIAENIASLLFTYMDRNGNVTIDPTRVVSVGISITATNDIAATDYQAQARSLTTTVKCRNL